MTIRFRLTLVALSLVLIALTAPSMLRADSCTAADNLVANCGFETGNFTGWTTIPASSGTDFDADGNPHSGSFAVEFGAVSGENDFISQNLVTTVGGTYNVNFWLSTGEASGEFVVNWDGNNIFTTGGTSGSYTEFSFVETATTTSTPLEFGGNNPPSFYYLDDVSVCSTTTPCADSAVPEPSSLSLLGIGLIGLAGLAKRKIHG